MTNNRGASILLSENIETALMPCLINVDNMVIVLI